MPSWVLGCARGLLLLWELGAQFAATNIMRLPTMKKYNLPTSFEFSQSYLFFYDKVIRSSRCVMRCGVR